MKAGAAHLGHDRENLAHDERGKPLRRLVQDEQLGVE
jgi:hypothetical protein